MHAQDIMSTPARTVRADAPLADAIELLQHFAITALPVVDDRDTLVGMLGERDLLRQAAVVTAQATGPRLVRDVMTGLPVVAWPEAEVGDLAAVMVQQDAHTIPVVADGRVIGVVSRCDVLRTLLPTDEAARRDAQRRLDAYADGRQRWPVTVDAGIAIIEGEFDDDTELAVAEALVRSTPGIAAVRVAEKTG
ncbi:CBS domain-containing protein [Dactylosporangium vinaceum]|uniref:CBS domain-containing protein n=1 Tax=Dactylosporangium vinaceum TaxID=53362 RepID=A0ABV5MAM2_9ACTN|nr:CBS domain-containing protein [Dactylosporangium vinaceum]UAB92971.1 CBS domain-containing protein [Dactylosporangium vinaceum]